MILLFLPAIEEIQIMAVDQESINFSINDPRVGGFILRLLPHSRSTQENPFRAKERAQQGQASRAQFRSSAVNEAKLTKKSGKITEITQKSASRGLFEHGRPALAELLLSKRIFLSRS